MSDNILRDVASRTKGEVYIGVVGSVRSGKSTFISRTCCQRLWYGKKSITNFK